MMQRTGKDKVVPQSDQEDPTEKILKLKRLFDAGALSQEEFDTKKAELLERM